MSLLTEILQKRHSQLITMLTTVYSLPGDTNLKVAVHPKQKANADKGAVIYTGSDGKVITTDENYTLDVKNAEINKNYILRVLLIRQLMAL